MSDQMERRTTKPDRFLRLSAVAFAVGFAIHGLDHLRRGLSAAPMHVMIIGVIQGVFVVIAIRMVLHGRDGAALAAILVGFGSALLFSYGHLLPTTTEDSFVLAPDPSVTWFSWLSAVAEIGTGIVFGIAGLQAWMERPRSRRLRTAG